MSDQTSPEYSSEHTAGRKDTARRQGDEAVLARRGLIRAGALAAAATAGAVAASATSATKASAAVGDTIKIGQSFAASNAATSLTVTDSTTMPVLRLTNLTGPALTLTPLTNENDPPNLPVGAIANSSFGPYIGLRDDTGAVYTGTLATGDDLAVMAIPTAIPPLRLLDTRYASGRGGIVGSSSGAFDSNHRLKTGAYLDLAIGDATADVTLEAAFLNVTVTGGLGNGYLTLYPSGDKPNASTLNFAKGQTLSNGAFVALGVIEDSFVVRVATSQTVHVIVDLSGATVTGVPGPAAAGASGATARSRRSRPAARFTRSLGHARRRV